jgi:general secretion pathway protein K
MKVIKLRQVNSQRGIALITVMLVLAVVTVALVSMSSDRQMDIRRTENQLRSTQAWEYAYGLEAWAENQLKSDFDKNKYDALTDPWSKPLSVKATLEGSVKADIIELQGRINLNNLLVEGKPSDEDVQRLKRLLSNLNINPELVDTMLDWMDEDMEIRYPHGAEDETYTKFKPPYRSANVPFADISELLRIQGISLKDYNKMLPYLYVAERYEPININTASVEVLRTLAPDIKKDQAESLYRASGKPFEKVEDFLKDEAIEGIIINKASISVDSHYFLLSGQIDMEKNGLLFQSQIYRDKLGGVAVLKRLRRSLVDG